MCLEQLSLLQSSGGAAEQGANKPPTHVVASIGENNRVTQLQYGEFWKMHDRLNRVENFLERVPLAAQISRSSLDSCLYRSAAQVQPHTPRMSLDSLRHMLSSLGKAQLTQRGHDHRRCAMATFVFYFYFWGYLCWL